jgi:pyocin large subunit-like protein
VRIPLRAGRLVLLWLAVVALALLFAPGDLTDDPPLPQSTREPAAPDLNRACDFRDRPKLLDHHERHGADFGSPTPADYLAAACRLRDAPLSQDVLELQRRDGVLCRFRRSDGAFLAYRGDGTILTCFKPGRGERYFLEQGER